MRTPSCPLLLCLLLAAGAPGAVRAQQGDRFVIPLSQPGQPAHVAVSLVYGSVSIEGHADGGEVIIEARAAEDRHRRGHERAPGGARDEGMRRLPNRSLGLAVEEQGNRVKVSMDGAPRAAELYLRVPRRCSLVITTVNNGDLRVSGVEGVIELQNTNGNVSALEVAGAVVAHTVNGEVKVSLTRVDPKAAMAFSTLNGHVDLTLPADTRASLRLRSDNGEIYSDFDVQIGPSVPQVEQGRSGGRFRLEVQREMRGSINGGGPEIQLRTFNGNIYLRRRG